MSDDLGDAARIHRDPTDDGGSDAAFKFDLGSAFGGAASPSGADPALDERPSALTAALDAGTASAATRPTPGMPSQDGAADPPAADQLPHRGPTVAPSGDPLPQRRVAPAAPEGSPERSPVAGGDPLPQRHSGGGRGDAPPTGGDPLPQRRPSAMASAADALPQRLAAGGRGEDAPAGSDPLPQRSRPASQPAPTPQPSRAPAPAAHDEPTPTEPARPHAAARRSVFDDDPTPVLAGGGPAPAALRQHQTPSQPPSEPSPRPSASVPSMAAFTAQEQPVRPAAPARVATAPTLPEVPAPVPPPASGANWAPVLPEASPAAPPMMAMSETPSGPTADDVRAYRRAQIRSEHQSHGKVIGRTLFAFASVATLIAMALVFGRAYLFPTEWDPALVDIVDTMQEERGIEFDHSVPLVTQSSDEYGTTVTTVLLGSEWEGRQAEWRALGLASGTVDGAVVADELARRWPAVYDPATDTVVQLADAPASELDVGLRIAMEDAFAAQTGTTPAAPAASEPSSGAVDTVLLRDPSLAGVSPPAVIAHRAADLHLAGTPVGASDTGDLGAAQIPLPIAYELAAVDELGEAVLQAAGADLATIGLGGPYPESLAEVLDDRPATSPEPTLTAGDTRRSEPTPLGPDDWSLVWGARLPGAAVDRLAQIVTADSYMVVTRGTTTCVVGEFVTANDDDGRVALMALTEWAGLAPQASGATASALTPTRVRVEACDPGPNAVVTPNPASIDGLLLRQRERLLAIVPVATPAVAPVGGPDDGGAADPAAADGTATPEGSLTPSTVAPAGD